MLFHAPAWRTPHVGTTVAFIAPSGTGKTTLARTLGPGLGYVSDETIAVDASLRIVPYPKPLSVKQVAAGVPKRQEGPDQHLLGATPAAPTLSGLAILSRAEGHAEASLEAVALGAAIVELTPQLSALARLDRGLVQLCRIIQACGGVKRVHYSEAGSIVGLLPHFHSPQTALAWRPESDWLPWTLHLQPGSSWQPADQRRRSRRKMPSTPAGGVSACRLSSWSGARPAGRLDLGILR